MRWNCEVRGVLTIVSKLVQHSACNRHKRWEWPNRTGVTFGVRYQFFTHIVVDGGAAPLHADGELDHSLARQRNSA